MFRPCCQTARWTSNACVCNGPSASRRQRPSAASCGSARRRQPNAPDHDAASPVIPCGPSPISRYAWTDDTARKSAGQFVSRGGQTQSAVRGWYRCNASVIAHRSTSSGSGSGHQAPSSVAVIGTLAARRERVRLPRPAPTSSHGSGNRFRMPARAETNSTVGRW